MFFKVIRFFKIAGLLSFLCLIIFGAGAQGEPFQWDFTLDPEGWQPGPGISSWNATPGKIAGGASSFSALIISPPLNVDADRFSILVLKLKTSRSYGNVRVLWTSPFDQQLSIMKSIAFSTGLAGRQRTYHVNMKENPNWEMIVSRLLIMPLEETGSFEIDSVSIEEPGIAGIFWCGFDDLFSLETLKASTVNFIYGPKIFGLSVNAIIYILIIIYFIYLMRIALARGWPGFDAFKNALPDISKKALIAVFSLWVLLDLRIDFDYLRIAYADWLTFAGKSLDEKHAIVTVGDYYQFLQFCDKVLPERSRISFSSADSYIYEKGAYYLYPHLYDRFNLGKRDADYLIVYNQVLSPSSSYEVFAKFAEDKYILKRNIK